MNKKHRWWCESFNGIIEGVDTLKYESEQDFIKENNHVVQSMGLHVQCVLNFADNSDEDGGTLIVPRFHKLIKKWCEVHIDMNFAPVMDVDTNIQNPVIGIFP